MPDNRKLLLLVYSVRLCNIAGDRLIVKRDLSHKWAAQVLQGFTSFLSILHKLEMSEKKCSGSNFFFTEEKNESTHPG